MENVPESQPPVNTSPQPPNYLLMLLIGLVIFISGGAGGFYLADHKELLSAFNLGPKPVGCTLEAKICPDGSSVGRTGPNCEFAACPAPADPTADWKNYTNKDYNFSLKYPQESDFSEPQLIPAEGGAPIYRLLITFNYNKKLSLNAAPENIAGNVSISWSKKRTTKPSFSLDEYVQNHLLAEKYSCPRGTFSNISSLQIDGNETRKYSVADCFNDIRTNSYFISHNGYFFIIDLSFKNEPSFNKYQPVFDQILSTFKFTENISPSPLQSQNKTLNYLLPSGWKTAQDKTGTFEVGYNPSDNQPFIGSGDLLIEFAGTWLSNPTRHVGDRYSVSIQNYSGLTSKEFLYQKLNLLSDQINSNNWKMPDFHEKEYSFNSWSCLAFYGVSISQFPVTWVTCPIDQKRAVLLVNDAYESSTEEILSTIKLLK